MNPVVIEPPKWIGCSAMSQLNANSRLPLTGPTLAYRTDGGPVTPPPRCRVVDHCGESGSLFHSEIETLLRGRLRIVTIILLFPLIFFFLKGLIDADANFGPSKVDLSLQAVVIAVIAGVSGLLWLRPCLCLGTLRTIELIIFGTMAVF